MQNSIKHFAITLAAACLSMMVPSSASAQVTFYSDTSGYGGYVDPYTYSTPYYDTRSVPFYGHHQPRHLGSHRGFHITPDAGVHWGRHYGEHRVGSRRAHGSWF